MKLVEYLERIRLELGRSIVLPTPPACLALLDQAKAAGIAIRTLYILSRSLTPGVCGSYDRTTGDLWCHLNIAEEDGARKLLQCLLILIAHVKRGAAPPTTIEQDWEQTEAAHQEAFALARTWGREELFTEDELMHFLDRDHHHYLAHIAAGELAGSLDPTIARLAYSTLREMKARERWSEEEFEAALNGVREDDEEANAMVLDFNRCELRARWLSSRTPSWDNERDPFGEYALAQTPKTVLTLRSALEQAARSRAEGKEFRIPQPLAGDTACTFLRVEGSQDLALALAHANSWLIEAFPTCYAQVHWRLYAERSQGETAPSAVHLYHLRVAYTSCEDETSDVASTEARQRELWVLFPDRHRLESVEAAWQRYIRSWLAWTDLRTEALSDGMRSLWSLLEHEP